MTNSRLPGGKVTKVYNGRSEVENRFKEGKNTLRWDKTSCQRFEANQARLKMGVLAYNLLHMIRQFYVWGEEVKRSIGWLIKRLVKVGARFSYHARRWYVHVASAFPLAYPHRAVLTWVYGPMERQESGNQEFFALCKWQKNYPLFPFIPLYK